MLLIGIDIGGTKCAASLGHSDGNGNVEIVHKCEKHATASYTPDEMLAELLRDVRRLIGGFDEKPCAVGISCGGPLDSKRGIIQSPPNLPGWNDVHVVEFFEKETGIPAFLCNDANAGALAEWRMGAGRGANNVVFLTFGTGMGAGLILDGRLYEGTNGMAGEVGHVRLSPDGPTGYGKPGSFEGFCSGGGIAQLAKKAAAEELKKGNAPGFCPTADRIESITAMNVRIAAQDGDPLARRIMEESGRKLGAALSVIIDILNPERIVIGSIYSRAEELMRSEMERVINDEALEASRRVCRVLPCGLSESVGDIAALTVADYFYERYGKK